MSETATETNVQKREASADNWAALNASKQFGDIELIEKQEKVEEEKKQVEVKTEVEGQENTDGKTGEVKTETKEEKKEEKKEDGAEQKKGEKEIDAEKKEGDKKDEKTTEVDLEFTPEDVGLTAQHPEDSWLKLGQDMGLELKEDSDVALKEAFESKIKEAEERGRNFKKEDVFAELKPEVATVLKLMEATGMTAEQALLPTQTLENYLKLDDAELVRQDLMERDGWDQERVDAEMEFLTEKGFLKHEAIKIREDLNIAKQNIERERQIKLQEYEQNKQRVADQKAQEYKSQIESQLKSMGEFMGGKLPEATREAMVQKFNQGGYDNILNDPKAIAEFISYKTLGEKAFKAKLAAEYQRGKLEKAKDLANVPPVGSKTGNQSEQKVNQINNWDALVKSKEFGEK